MAVVDQMITDRYALYSGDCIEVMPTLPDGVGASVDLLAAVRRAVPLPLERARPVELPRLRASSSSTTPSSCASSTG